MKKSGKKRSKAKISREKKAKNESSDLHETGYRKLTEILEKSLIEFNSSLFDKYSEILTASIAESKMTNSKTLAEKFNNSFLQKVENEKKKQTNSISKFFKLELPKSISLSGLGGSKINISSKKLLEFTTYANSANKQIIQKILELVPSYSAEKILRMLDQDIVSNISKPGKRLIKELTKCENNKNFWIQYEEICLKIMKHCFYPPLDEIYFQSRNITGGHKRDIILKIPFGILGSWGLILAIYGPGVVVDCKNYKRAISGTAINDISKYIGDGKISTLGIIFTRIQPKQSAMVEQIDQYKNVSKKLIVCLTDDDLIKMIKLKDSKKDPITVIEKAIFDFRLSI